MFIEASIAIGGVHYGQPESAIDQFGGIR